VIDYDWVEFTVKGKAQGALFFADTQQMVTLITDGKLLGCFKK
jgi:hypothetical protein